MIALGLMLLELGALRVSSSSACPTAEEVTAQLRVVAGDTLSLAAPLEVVLTDDAADVTLTLIRPGGPVVARHRFAAATPCATRALGAAAIVAVWAGELAGAPAPAPVSIAPPTRLEVRVAPAVPPSRVQFEVGVRFLGAVAGGFAPGVTAHALITRRGVRWAGRLAVLGTAPREISLGAGHLDWTRIGASAGALVRFTPSRLVVDLHADVLLAALRLAGVGFDQDRTSTSFDPGLALAASLGVRIGATAPQVGVALVGWPRAQQARLLGAPEVAKIPQLEAYLTAGVSFGTF